ncbi:hypothetical protein AGMMS50276_28720 [Synergistales bacterium]|nr:hypothetical protein AGMMS50276_28720 [Synergistales bacterium]
MALVTCRDASFSYIMISHDIQSAAQYATHILHLRTKQAFFGTAAEYTASSVCARFLGGERK